MSVSHEITIDNDINRSDCSPEICLSSPDKDQTLNQDLHYEHREIQASSGREQSTDATIERLNALYDYATEEISILKRELDIGFSASGLAVAERFIQNVHMIPSYISLIHSKPYIAMPLQQINAGKVVSLLKKLVKLICDANTGKKSALIDLYGSLIFAITKLTDLSESPILFKLGFKRFVNDEDRRLLIQNGFFAEFVAITEHLSSAKLQKYYLWALQADQVEFAEALVHKSDWPRMHSLVPEESLRQIRRLYKRKLSSTEAPTKDVWNTIGHILENYRSHGIRASLAVERAFEVAEYSAIKRLYRGSNARFDGSPLFGLNLIKGKSQREQHYLFLALLTGEKDVVEHVLGETCHVPGKIMSDIVSTITTLVHGTHRTSDLSELLEMFGVWGERHQCARVLLTGKPFRSISSRNYWRMAGCAYSRRRLQVEMDAKLAQLEEENREEVDCLLKENAALSKRLAEFVGDTKLDKVLAKDSLPRPSSPSSSADANSSGSESGFDSSAETLNDLDIRQTQN